MKKKKYLVKIKLYDSNKEKIKYLNHNSLFTDLEELEKNLEIFCKHFNEQKIEEICNNYKCKKEEIKVEKFNLETDRLEFNRYWTTIMFTKKTKHGYAPIDMYKYMIIDK